MRRNTGTRTTTTTTTAGVSLQTERRCCRRRIFRVKFRYLSPSEKTSGNVLVKLTGLSSCARARARRCFPVSIANFSSTSSFPSAKTYGILAKRACLSHFRSKIFSHAKILCIRIARELCVLCSKQACQNLFSFHLPLLSFLALLRYIQEYIPQLITRLIVLKSCHVCIASLFHVEENWT